MVKKILLLILATMIISSPSVSAQANLAPEFAFTALAIVQQDKVPAKVIEVAEAGDDKFHRSVIQAAAKQVRDGTLKRRDLIKLRVAMLSPAFREHAKELAIVQISASGSDAVPMSADGTVDEVAIDWTGLSAFLEKLVPLILMLIKAFGGTA